MQSTILVDLRSKESKVKPLNEFENEFEKQMQEFPCSFNIGCVDVRDLTGPGDTLNIHTPVLLKKVFKNLVADLEDRNDDKEFEKEVWKENLLTRVYYELHKPKDAIGINQKILNNHPDNLTALANTAFLYFLSGEVDKSFRVKATLEQLKEKNGYERMKLDALIEQAYAYRKFGGGKYLLSCINILTLVSSKREIDEKVQFQLALVYRRLCFNKVSLLCIERSQTEDIAVEAARRLHLLGTSATDQNIRAAAIAELAYFRYNDKYKDSRMVATEIWRDLLGDMSWKRLCFKALEITKSNERVIKIVGSVLKSDPKDRPKAIELLKQAIEIRPSTRAYHHLGLAYVKQAIQYEIERAKSQTKTPKQAQTITATLAEIRLKRLLKIRKHELLQFSAGNTFVELAEENLSKAVEVSKNLNVKAHQDLVILLARSESYAKAVQNCKKMIKFYESGETDLFKELNLVTMYDLYGSICALAAKIAETRDGKNTLQSNSEKNYMKAIRLATHIAVCVPEFIHCATNLWESFHDLTTKYTFDACPDSKQKLVKLCELVKDYRHLPKVEEIIALLKEHDYNKDCIESYAKNLLGSRRYDEASYFLDMVKIRFGGKYELTWRTSEVYKDLMLHQARHSLRSSPDSKDPIWLNIFQEEYDVVTLEKRHQSSSRSQSDEDICSNQEDLRIIIVEDIIDDDMPIQGSWSDKVSGLMKKIINQNFGIGVERGHEIGHPGEQLFETLQNAISTATVALFVLDNEKHPSSNSTGSKTQGESPHSSLHDTKAIDNFFNSFINAAVISKMRSSKPLHIITVVKDKAVKLPSSLIDRPTLVLSTEDVDCLSAASDINLDKKIEIIMRVFCKMVRRDYDSATTSELSRGIHFVDESKQDATGSNYSFTHGT